MALTQLIAYGAQDTYITPNHQIIFFRTVYRQHTNFSMPYDENWWDGKYNNIPVLYINEKYILLKIDLTNRNIECPVTFTNLTTPRCKYITCRTCQCNFCESVLEDWVKIYKTCPHCRSEWICNEKYISKDGRTKIIKYVNRYINLNINEMRDDEIYDEETGTFTIIDENADNIDFMKENWITNYFEEELNDLNYNIPECKNQN